MASEGAQPQAVEPEPAFNQAQAVVRPLNRRRALRVLGALAAATAGAAVVSATRPEPVSATTVSYSDNTSSPVIQGTNAGSGPGVEGTASGFGTGVYGTGFNGVYGNGTYGVYGTSIGGIGVYGTSNGSSSNGAGVWGQNTGGGPAIVGFSPSGVGFSAVTATGTGCFGGASGAGTGVYAYSGAGTALAAQAAGAGAYAGYFVGSVFVTGALTVLGAKSAAVKGADGSLRRLYSLESPESWFEDFGSGQLNGGTATIQLEPGFAGVVKTNQYHVYLTPRGAPKGPLYIDDAGSSSFTVHDAGGASNIAFDYRIVAKRKDIAGARLEHVPDVTVPSAPTFPTPPESPPAPAPVSPQRQGP